MNRAMPSRAAVLFALVLLLVASVAVWVRSYWTYDVLTVGAVAMASESGSVYVFRSVEMLGFHDSGKAGENGRLEVETDSIYHPWLPVWTWEYAGNQFFTWDGGRWYWWRRAKCGGSGADDAERGGASR